MIKRFAPTVTLIYDADAAGIKAALRGIDMFVAAGIALRIVLLPEGEDPDSFAQSHTSSEVEDYLATHSQDLIGFKTDILLKDSQGDPHKRSEAITDILRTISLIPDLVEQSVYIDECAKKVGMDASTLAAQVKVLIARNRESEYKQRQLQDAARSLSQQPQHQTQATTTGTTPAPAIPRSIYIAEEDLIRYVLRYGAMYLCDVSDNDEVTPMNVITYIRKELEIDNIGFTDPTFDKMWHKALEITDGEWVDAHNARAAQLQAEREAFILAEREKNIACGMGMNELQNAEEAAVAQADAQYNEAIDRFDKAFIRDRMVRLDDRPLIDATVTLTTDPVVLSKMHPKINIREELCAKLPMAIYCLKGALLKEKIKSLTEALATAQGADADSIMTEIMRLKEASMEFDRYNGEIVITPTIKR